jgi:formaldehyde-activating enzyme involved in methanogenesis
MEWRAISAISGVVVIAATFVNWTYRQIVKMFRKDFDELKEQIQVTIKTSKKAKKLAKRALYEARRAADQSKLWEARNEGRNDYGQSQITNRPRD